MRCYICDQELTKIQLDKDLKTLPCEDCQEVIDETVSEFEDELMTVGDIS